MKVVIPVMLMRAQDVGPVYEFANRLQRFTHHFALSA
jgi:hypothetical protein